MKDGNTKKVYYTKKVERGLYTIAYQSEAMRETLSAEEGRETEAEEMAAALTWLWKFLAMHSGTGEINDRL